MKISIDCFIDKYAPCQKGADFARAFRTMREVWNALAKGKGDPSWLVWLASRNGVVDRKVLVRATCAAVRTSPVGDKTLWEHLTDERSRNAIIVAEAWVDGKATLDDARKAAKAAYDAAYATASDAAYAAYAAADAADAAAYAYAACAAAARAARAAAYAAYAAYAAVNEHFREVFATMIPNPFEE